MGPSSDLSDRGELTVADRLPEDVERLLAQALRELRAFGPGWGRVAVLERVYDICKFAVLNGPPVIPLERRRRIGRLASDIVLTKDGSGAVQEMSALADRERVWRTPGADRPATRLLAELDGLGGLSAEFLVGLGALAASERQKFITSNDWGGNRRSGERTLKNSVLGMIVWLYCEAHAKPGAEKTDHCFGSQTP